MDKFRDTSLDFETRADDLLSKLTLEEKFSFFCSGHDGIERLGLKEYFMGQEMARGVTSREGKMLSIVFPQPIGMAATFDVDLIKRIGEAASDEARIYSTKNDTMNLCVWAPTIDMERDPRWGRTEEAYGEDPVLAGEMCAALTKGMVGDDDKYLKIIPMLKHFYANNNETDRCSTSNSNITPELKRNYYLKPFKIAFEKGGAKGVMTAYNYINGIEAINHPDIRDFLKNECGAISTVSDGGDFGMNVSQHKTFDTNEQSFAVILGINGADIMLDSPQMVIPAVKNAYEQGFVSLEEIDRAVKRNLMVRFLLGEFDDNQYRHIPENRFCSKEFDYLSLEAAKKSVVLLKNDSILPLNNKEIKTIVVLGPICDENYQCWYCGVPDRPQISVFEGIKTNFPEAKTVKDNSFNHIIIKSRANGKYLRVSENGRIKADADADSADIFEHQDWDHGSGTLKNLRTKKFVSSWLDGTSCSKSRDYDWFMPCRYHFENVRGGTVLKTWQGGMGSNALSGKEYNKLLSVSEDGDVEDIFPRAIDDSQIFDITIVSNGLERAAALAKTADLCVIAAGNQPMINGREGEDRQSLYLPQNQSELINEISKIQKKSVLCLISSYPYAIGSEEKQVKAVINISHAGPHLGAAIGETLTGANNPAGRLPLTWYEDEHDLPSIFDYDIAKNKTTYLYYESKPLYPFAYGLSYSSFEYSNLLIKQTGTGVDVSVNVKNTSKIDGDEVVQIYVTLPDSVFNTPKHQLIAFKRINITAGKTENINVSIPLDDLKYYDYYAQEYILIDGEYTFRAGRSSDTGVSAKINIKGKKIRGVECENYVNPLSASDYYNFEFLTDKNDEKEYLYSSNGRSWCTYKNLIVKNAKAFTILASSPAGECEAKLINVKTGEIIAEFIITSTGSLKRFAETRIEIEPLDGLIDIKIILDKTVCIKGFKFR